MARGKVENRMLESTDQNREALDSESRARRVLSDMNLPEHLAARFRAHLDKKKLQATERGRQQLTAEIEL